MTSDYPERDRAHELYELRHRAEDAEDRLKYQREYVSILERYVLAALAQIQAAGVCTGCNGSMSGGYVQHSGQCWAFDARVTMWEMGLTK